MTLEQQQAIFDEEKWRKSIETGEDLCGTYEFCSLCIKDKSYPCARAARKYSGEGVRLAVVHIKR